MLSIISKNPEETQEFGKKIGKNLFPTSIIALSGKLGSGKTTLIQGIGQGLGITTPIKSPSFTLINEYQGFLPLYHFDLYRLSGEEEIEELGYEEYLFKKKGVVVIEWADKMESFLTFPHLKIKIKMIDFSQREIILIPNGIIYEKLVEKLLISV